MRRDLLIGFGAFSALMLLIGIDLALTLIAHQGQRASTAILRSLKTSRGRPPTAGAPGRP